MTTIGLVAGPVLWVALGSGAAAAMAGTWAVRLAGLMLAAASGWALTHGVWATVWAYCVG